MAYVLTLLYIAVTLLSPAVFPDAITSLHVNLILGVLVIMTAVWSIGESKIAWLPDAYLGVGLLFATIVSMLATGWIGGALASFLDFAPILITFYFVAITCNSLRRIKILVFVLVLVGFYIFAQGAIADHTGNITSKYLMTESISEGINTTSLHRYRGLGVLSDPNDVAQFYVMTIPLLWLRWKKGKYLTNFLFTLLPAAVLALAVYFTHSRGGAIALVAVIMFGFKDRLSVVGSAVLGVLALVGLLALNVAGGRGISEDDGGRVAAWATGLETIKSHPILGVGPGNFPNYNPTGHTAHNSFILAMAELGFVGYFFWMGMIVSSWTGLSQMIRSRISKIVPENSSNTLNSMRPARNERPSSAMARLVKNPVGVPGLLTHSIAKPASTFAAPAPNNFGTWSPSVGRYGGDLSAVDQRDADQLAYAAKIVRISFVGLLTAGFFLSRTYAVTLYIMLGIAVSLIKMNVPLPTVNLSSLAKKTATACLVSAVFLYLFVRLHGGK